MYTSALALALVATGLCAALLTWLACHDGLRILARRRTAFTTQARARLGELFLFINPGWVWTLSLGFCVVAALTAIALTGSAILAETLASAPGDLALGIGRYHHWKDEHRARSYGQRVISIWQKVRAQ